MAQQGAPGWRHAVLLAATHFARVDWTRFRRQQGTKLTKQTVRDRLSRKRFSRYNALPGAKKP